jgi:type VI secretion system protein VasJ
LVSRRLFAFFASLIIQEIRMSLSFVANLEPWLLAIPGGIAAGTPQPSSAALAAVKVEIDKLSAISGPAVDWPRVLENGRKVLLEWKDIPVAAQAAYAALECQGLAGFAIGLGIFGEVMERFWEDANPKRPRARTNAVTWLVERAATRLEGMVPDASEAAALARVSEATKHLAQIVRTRWENDLPPLSPLEKVVERLRLSMPADASPAPSASEPAPVPARSAPPGSAAGEPAPVVAAATPPAPEQPAPEANDEDQPRKRAESSVAALLAPSPAGSENSDPNHSAEGEALRAEIAKRDNPAAGTCDWSVVEKNARALLTNRGKDLRAACYFAYAMIESSGIAGLYQGLVLLSGLCTNHWQHVYPLPRRGSLGPRRTPFLWLTEYAPSRLETLEVKFEDSALLKSIRAYFREASSNISEAFGDEAPSLRSLGDAIERLYLSLPPPPQVAASPAAPAPPVAAVPQKPNSSPTPSASPPAVAVASPPPPVAKAAETVEEISGYLVSTGQGLCKAARLLRTANAFDPLAYRLNRQGLWLHLVNPPPADASGQTSVPSLGDRRSNFETLARNSKWEVLLDEAESALAMHRFCLDLNFFVVTALRQLGSAGEGAMRAITGEVAAFLARMPQLLNYRDGAGQALASEETKSWIARDVLGGASNASSPSSAASAEQNAWLDELGDVAKVEIQKLLELGQSAFAAAGDVRERLRRQVAFAGILADREPALAANFLASIDRELRERGLETWERELTLQTYALLITVTRKLNAARGGGPRSELALRQEDEWIARLAHWDMATAARYCRA